MAAGRTRGKNMHDDHSNSSETPREREREKCVSLRRKVRA